MHINNKEDFGGYLNDSDDQEKYIEQDKQEVPE